MLSAGYPQSVINITRVEAYRLASVLIAIMRPDNQPLWKLGATLRGRILPLHHCSKYRRYIVGTFTYVQPPLCNLRIVMFRIVAIALVALAAFDLGFLGGSHVYTAMTIARSLLHHFVG